MARQGVFRNVNILSELTPDNTTESIDLYTPGTINPFDIVTGAKYSGFVTSLRLMVNISSIAELILPSTSPSGTQLSASDIEKDYVFPAPKKCLSLYLRNSLSQKPIEVADIFLFNRRPYYFVNLIKYFTGAQTFDVAPDTVVSLQIKHVGYGLLENNDRISIVGSALEEAPYIESSVLEVE